MLKFMSNYLLHSRKGNRLKGFDYSFCTKYFITTNVKWRCFSFGEIVNGCMNLNHYGEIAEAQWNWLLERYPYVISYAFVIMPDHIHAVIELNSEYYHDNTIKIKSLSEVVGAFKMRVSKEIHLAGAFEFTWQRSFHDRIIRSADEFEACVKYVLNNPRNSTNQHKSHLMFQ